jgi:hypothetical protein
MLSSVWWFPVALRTSCNDGDTLCCQAFAVVCHLYQVHSPGALCSVGVDLQTFRGLSKMGLVARLVSQPWGWLYRKRAIGQLGNAQGVGWWIMLLFRE